MRRSLPALMVVGAFAAQSTRGTTELSFDAVAVSVDYGRPNLKDRDMVSLLPVGHVWRLGADEATTFQTSHDLRLGQVVIPAGSYSLFLKRTDQQDWALVFNTETGQWGTQHDVTLDFAEVAMEWTRRDDSCERLTIGLSAKDDGGELGIYWDVEALSVLFRQA